MRWGGEIRLESNVVLNLVSSGMDENARNVVSSDMVLEEGGSIHFVISVGFYVKHNFKISCPDWDLNQSSVVQKRLETDLKHRIV